MHQTFNYLQRVSTSTQNMGKHWYSINYTTIPELYMVNTRATLWFDIVLDFLPSQRDGFRCHSFTIRDVLALKVFVRLNSIFLVFHRRSSAGRLAISRRPSPPSGARKRLYQDYSSHTHIICSNIHYHMSWGSNGGATVTSPPWTVILLTITRRSLE